MSEIENISPRISVVKTDAELSIVISSVADRSSTRLMGFWLLLWLVCGVIALVYLVFAEDSEFQTMLLIWLGFWVYFAYAVGKAWLWRRFGNEIIKVQNGRLLIKRDVRGRGFVNTYPVNDIQKIRPNSTKAPGWVQKLGGNYLNTEGESIAFDTSDKEIQLGYQLSILERDAVLKMIRHYIKINRSV